MAKLCCLPCQKGPPLLFSTPPHTPHQPLSSHATSPCRLPHLLRTAFRLPASQRQPFSSDIVPVGAPGEGALGGRPSSLPLLVLW